MDYMSNRLKYDLINPHGFHELMIGTVRIVFSIHKFHE